MAIADKIKRAWNAFSYSEKTENDTHLNLGPSSSARPDKVRLAYYSERSIVSAIYNRMAMDMAGIPLRHVKVDDQNRYAEDMDSPLNDCLTLEPNMDQAPRAWRQDVALTMFDNGVAALVPVDVADKPDGEAGKEIYTIRTGDVISYHPKHVKLRLYNEDTGVREDIILDKSYVGLVENPLYSVMNEPNSTLQRLIVKLAMLDQVDQVSSSGKLDIIIQLPYTIRSEAKREQAEQRRTDIEMQLKGSQYGIAYADATEKITQLNRPAENNLLAQVEYLTRLLYNQLGLTEAVMDGTADEAAMLNYFNRTIEPLLDAFVEAMNRSFLGHVGIKRGERILYIQDPFKLVPVNELADIADKFTRNEILTSNEVRQHLGMRPSSDPRADELINKNMPQPDEEPEEPEESEAPPEQPPEADQA